MVSPGQLRTVRALRDDDRDAFEPVVGERGEVAYPLAERTLDERDGDPVAVLESLADRGVLSSSFEHAIYVCPSCDLEGMQYGAGCPTCGSLHATRTPVEVHAACGALLERDPGDDPTESDEDRTCPDCDAALAAEDLEADRAYRCHECDAPFDEPSHRLWCRGCDRVARPDVAREAPLYRYPLTAAGERWVDDQVAARRLFAETLEARGYETTVDATASGPDGQAFPVHVSAADDLLDHRIVADVHESPTVADVRRLADAASAVDARPTVVATDGSLDERVAGAAADADVAVVSASDETLSREVETTADRSRGSRPVIDRLESLLSSSAFRR